MLLPLTESLYVSGVLESVDTVLLEVRSHRGGGVLALRCDCTRGCMTRLLAR